MVHCPGDIPEYYGEDCEHYNPQPIDQAVADEVAALPHIWDIDWGDMSEMANKYWRAEKINNSFYEKLLGRVPYGTTKGKTIRIRRPSDPSTKEAEDNDHTRDCVAYGQVKVYPKTETQGGY